jgi:hypothetical protein
MVLATPAPFAQAASHQVQQIQAFSASNAMQINVVLSAAEGYKVFTLTNPDRLVVDVKNAQWKLK